MVARSVGIAAGLRLELCTRTEKQFPGKERGMATAAATTTGGHHSGKWYQHLYVQVLAAITAGILLGHFYPQLGEQMKPLGDAFIKCIKMIIAPIIFFTVVHGIASMRDMK